MDALQYNKKLVSFESTSSLSNVEVTEFCEQTLKELGFATERVDYTDPAGLRKANVIGKNHRQDEHQHKGEADGTSVQNPQR